MNYSVSNIVTYSDYYPFGMLMPGRNGGGSYRYAFNGMEKDDEVKGNGNSYTTEFRQYDPRLGRWLSLDPVTHHDYSPYSAFDNNPIYYADPSGANSETNGETDPPSKEEKSKENKKLSLSLDISYAPMKFAQIGRNVKWKQQNDLGYLNLNKDKKPKPTGGFDETSAIYKIKFVNFDTEKANITLKSGLGYARIKGGILSADGSSQEPHFNHGLGNFGLNFKAEITKTNKLNLSLSAALGITGGIAISGFDDPIGDDGAQRYSQGVNISGLDKSVPSWSTRGWGATGYSQFKISFGTGMFQKKSEKDMFRISLGGTLAVHSITLNPYENLDTGQIYGKSQITTFGLGGLIGVSINVDTK